MSAGDIVVNITKQDIEDWQSMKMDSESILVPPGLKFWPGNARLTDYRTLLDFALRKSGYGDAYSIPSGAVIDDRLYRLDIDDEVWLHNIQREAISSIADSTVRRVQLRRTKELAFQHLGSLGATRSHHDGFVIMSGDWGGQIYAVIPVSMIKCSEERLWHLLTIFDDTAGLNPDGKELMFGRMESGHYFYEEKQEGWMGQDIWLHEDFSTPEWLQLIHATIGNMQGGE